MNESGSVRATWDQLYPLGQLLGPSDLGQPFLLKGVQKNRALQSVLIDPSLDYKIGKSEVIIIYNKIYIYIYIYIYIFFFFHISLF